MSAKLATPRPAGAVKPSPPPAPPPRRRFEVEIQIKPAQRVLTPAERQVVASARVASSSEVDQLLAIIDRLTGEIAC